MTESGAARSMDRPVGLTMGLPATLADSQKLCDELDYQRAGQAYFLWMPELHWGNVVVRDGRADPDVCADFTQGREAAICETP